MFGNFLSSIILGCALRVIHDLTGTEVYPNYVYVLIMMGFYAYHQLMDEIQRIKK